MLSFTSTLDFQEILLQPVCMAVMARKAPKILSKGILYDQEKCSPKSMWEKDLFLFSRSVLLPLGSRGRHSYRKHKAKWENESLALQQKVQAKGDSWKPRGVWKNTERKKTKKRYHKVVYEHLDLCTNFACVDLTLNRIVKSLRTKI